jgi:hypothetical protein
VIRVKQWDTIEHVTDFDSASDHVRNREKFEELNIPVLKGLSRLSDQDLTSSTPKSSFEPNADVTSYEVEEGLDGAGIELRRLGEELEKHAKRKSQKSSSTETDSLTPNTWKPNLRWKHDGPWLPGMGADEFMTYVTKELAPRKREFNKYLVQFVKTQISLRRKVASQESLPLDEEEAKTARAKLEKEWNTFTKEDIQAGIRSLREKCAADPLSSDLVQKLIIPFLRLPPIKLQSARYSANQLNVVGAHKFADETTPSSTHPSAGLSYLRTKAYLANHPILGPQALPAPVEARVIQPRKTRGLTQTKARLGVAGFVADDEFAGGATGFQSYGANRVASLEVLDVETEGGRKVPVQPAYAAVSPDGRVHIGLKRSHGPELQVAKGLLEDTPPPRENVDSDPLANLTGFARGGSAGAAGGEVLKERSDVFFKRLTSFNKPKEQQTEA